MKANDPNGILKHIEAKNPPNDSTIFEVQGAGAIAIGNNLNWICAQAKGAQFEVSWSRSGFSGGVMDKKEMLRLRNHLNEVLGEPTP